MQWADVVRTPPPKQLRQFGALFLIFFLGLAAMRWWQGRVDAVTWAMAAGAVVFGVGGMVRPAFVKPIYMGWMVAAFPIGWTVSRLMLATVFFMIVTPIAVVFRVRGRDPLRLRRGPRATYWVPKRQASASSNYFRQF